MLNLLQPAPGSTHRRKLLGRGIGSGKGKTSGKGHKGQKARTGIAIKGFEGGQTPIHRRIPKRGFKSHNHTFFQEVNLGRLQKALENGKLDAKGTVNAEALKKAGLIRCAKSPVKLLGLGEISTKVNLEVCAASAGAKAAVEKAGGSVTVLSAAPKAKAEKTEKAAPKKAAKAKK